jgi:hypothetical protein
MDEFKCTFNSTLLGGQFGCARAQAIVRRGGPDVACTSEPAHARCERVFQYLKQAALPAFGVEDDLLSMPHSVLVKIQFGGLLGLQRLVEPAAGAEVKDIDALLARTQEKYPDLATVDYPALTADMTAYQLKRRR